MRNRTRKKRARDSSDTDTDTEPDPEPEVAEADLPEADLPEPLLDWLLPNWDLLRKFVESSPEHTTGFSFHTAWVKTLWNLATPEELVWLSAVPPASQQATLRLGLVPPRLQRAVLLHEPWRQSLAAWLTRFGDEGEVRVLLQKREDEQKADVKQVWSKLANLLRRRPTASAEMAAEVLVLNKIKRKWVVVRTLEAIALLGSVVCHTTSPSIAFRLTHTTKKVPPVKGVLHAIHGAARSEVTLDPDTKVCVLIQADTISRLVLRLDVQ